MYKFLVTAFVSMILRWSFFDNQESTIYWVLLFLQVGSALVAAYLWFEEWHPTRGEKNENT